MNQSRLRLRQTKVIEYDETFLIVFVVGMVLIFIGALVDSTEPLDVEDIPFAQGFHYESQVIECTFRDVSLRSGKQRHRR